ncbi:MAG: cysteine--tRNA ligase [Actinomycetes bacterium]|nr:cysteine--tRNA ligase [Actinomycetes bacterium]MDX5380994.1 cysteine--tRNA ligase [Actinomycetes bacterium]MDX5400134.1 cysteine--tRNA ligase [Actinomycetes bacterium]MDX5450754.1 cysteine--tRNA ligase [Actinomycetes bacterium]
MGLRLYDSATRSVRDFVPLHPGRVGIYVCGATVQSSPHVGHMRTAIVFDVLRRWLERDGVEVTLIRNVTDIDDKILAKSAEQGVPWWAWAYRFENEFTAAYDALGLLRPTYEPRATGHVPEMVELIDRLIERGHAYAGQPGNVYFSVPSFPEYGALTNQGADAGEEDDAATDKRDPRDFAVWTAPKPGEPGTAQWDTPWGHGRPGWHLECSAMAHRYLGETFDIHGGGLDLRFPHHENELAQSRAAGYGFVRHWMHSAWATMGGEKMSKSLGNSLIVSEVLKSTPAPVVRLTLIAAHYRSMVEYSDTSVAEAAANWDRFTNFVTRAIEFAGEVDGVASLPLPAPFVAAMEDDLNTAAALAVVHEHVRLGNIALADGDREAVRDAQGAVRAMLSVLGLDPLAEQWRATDSAHGALGVLVERLLAERVEARLTKDWARADAIREDLLAAGVVVEDSVGGARWYLKG